MTYDPNAGGQNPWGQNPKDPNQSANAYGQNQAGQNPSGDQSHYGQEYSGQPGSGAYGQNPQGAQSDYGSYGASSPANGGSPGDYPQEQAVYGSGSANYGQDASARPDGYGQTGYGQGGFGQSTPGGYGQEPAYGQQPPYGQNAAYGDASGGYGQPGAAPAPPKKGKGMLIGLIAGGIVVLLVVAGLIWEFAGRGSAGNTYVALLEEQGIEINGDEAEGELDGSFAGGSYVFESLGGEFSKVVVSGPELVANDVPYDITYTLLGAPASGEGTIDRVRVDVDLAADAIVDVFFDDTDASDLQGAEVEITGDGITLSLEEFGTTMEMVIQISAVEGWMVMEVTSMTVDGEDFSSELGSDASEQVDPCESTDYESYVTEAEVDEDGIHFQWEIDDVTTSDLAMTTCMA